jgi:predicted DsbA family dithiol-disulfide isomerase
VSDDTNNEPTPLPRRLLLLAVLTAACEKRLEEPSPTAATDAPQRRPEPSAAPIVVEVYTDLVCPWCFIGTERLDRAIAASGLGARVVVRHRAFLLQPDTPEEGTDIRAYLQAKTGREPTEMFRRVEAVAKESGIPLDLSKQPRLYPTIRAHALLRRAAERGTDRALERALFRTYFLDGSDLTNLSTLVSLATQHGFSEADARRIVNDPAGHTAVRQEARQASARGITGVPYFVFPGGRTLSGAQSEQALLAALTESTPSPVPATR